MFREACSDQVVPKPKTETAARLNLSNEKLTAFSSREPARSKNYTGKSAFSALFVASSQQISKCNKIN
jgi:hypothetical protein